MREIIASYGYAWVEGIGTVANRRGVYEKWLPLVEGVEEVKRVMEMVEGNVVSEETPEDRIREGARFLRSLCHSRQCDRVEMCPRGHVECAKGLSITTAVWWVAADYMMLAASVLENPKRVKEPKEVVWVLRAFREVALLHSRAKGAVRAASEMAYARDMVEAILSCGDGA